MKINFENFLQGIEWRLKYFEQSPMRKSRECKMQNFVSILMVLFIFEPVSLGALKP